MQLLAQSNVGMGGVKRTYVVLVANAHLQPDWMENNIVTSSSHVLTYINITFYLYVFIYLLIYLYSCY
jgi:hypothetical protein